MRFPEKFGQNHLTPSEGSEVKTIQRLAENHLTASEGSEVKTIQRPAGAVRLLVVFRVFCVQRAARTAVLAVVHFACLFHA